MAAMAVLSSPPPTTRTHHLSSSTHNRNHHYPSAVVASSGGKRNCSLSLPVRAASPDNGAGIVTSAAATTTSPPAVNGADAALPSKSGLKDSEDEAAAVVVVVKKFEDARWVSGNWDLKRFVKDDGSTDWDAVIDAEVRRRKWLETNPESSSNSDPVVFDTSIIPWWAWMKRFHLPEAELLNGRAAMVGFFMAYFVDSLTGAGLVDQMGNFFCKTLLFVAVLGVLLIRRNEDVDKLKSLLEETTFYDKQWQATWQDETTTKTD